MVLLSVSNQLETVSHYLIFLSFMQYNWFAENSLLDAPSSIQIFQSLIFSLFLDHILFVLAYYKMFPLEVGAVVRLVLSGLNPSFSF